MNRISKTAPRRLVTAVMVMMVSATPTRAPAADEMGSSSLLPAQELTPSGSLATGRALKWSGEELLGAGKILSYGSTLTQPAKMVPLLTERPLPSTPRSSVDMSQIDVAKLEAHAAEKVTDAMKGVVRGLPKNVVFGNLPSVVPPRASGPDAKELGERLAGEVAGPMIDAWKVGTGRADPTVLEKTVPHVVMAWRATRGPENLPGVSYWTRQSAYWSDNGAGKLSIGDNWQTKQTFKSTAPSMIGNYGYDPATDRLIRHTTGQSVTREAFDGRRFTPQSGSTVRPLPTVPTSPPTLRITPPALTSPSNTQNKGYSPPPINRTPAFSTPRSSGSSFGRK